MDTYSPGSKNSQFCLETCLGKRQIVSDHYNELTLKLSSADNNSEKMNVVFRVYNEGVAFRYLIPQESRAEQEVLSELTGFNFSGDFTAWYYNFENHNVEPELLSEADGDRMPVMTIKAGDYLYMAIHEACLDEGEPLKLRSKKENFRFLSLQNHGDFIRATTLPGELSFLETHQVNWLIRTYWNC